MTRRTPGTLLNDFLEQSAERFPDKTALICDGHRHTFFQLNATANQIANALRKRGAERGDRVAVFLENSAELVISLFGIWKAGAACVIINHQAKLPKLAFILNNCRTTGIISHSRFSQIHEAEQQVPSLEFFFLFGEEKDGSNGKRLSMKHLQEHFATTAPEPGTIDLDLAAILYTSGTTGFPKGACFTHRAMASISSSVNTYLENKETDIILNALPLSFGYGLSQALMSTQIGATLVLEKSFVYPQLIVQAMEREKITAFPGVPTVFAILLALKDIRNRDLSSVRYITNAAAALPPSYILPLKQIFPCAKVFSMYGVTECMRVTYMPPEELEARPTSVGKGMPNEEVYIVDENGEKVGPGEVGELVVRGSNIMMGYWEMPQENEKKLRPGRYPGERVLYSGDLFKMDEDGYLYFVARKDDIIKSRGEKVSPKEVEHVIYEMPEVFEVAVVGVDDEILGQAIKAFVAVKEAMQITERDILKHCAGKLEPFMVPKSVEFVAALPKTESGKIRKRDLVEIRPDELR